METKVQLVVLSFCHLCHDRDYEHDADEDDDDDDKYDDDDKDDDDDG